LTGLKLVRFSMTLLREVSNGLLISP